MAPGDPPSEPSLSRTALAVREARLTYLSPRKMTRLEGELARVLAAGVPGDVVEFGLALGGSAIVAAEQAAANGRDFIGLDVFAMIPAPTSDKDDAISKSRYAAILAGESKGMADDLYDGYRDDLLGDVTAAFARHGLPVDGERIRLDKGLFTQTWPAHRHRRLAFAHLDCDWYDPVSFCLAVMRDQLSPGGAAVVDDYHSWSGARLATDEFIAANPDFTLHDGDNVILRRAG